MREEVHAQVVRQFDAVAANYATSAGHSDPSSLEFLVSLAAPSPSDRLLDIGAGAGNTAFAFAPFVREACALDITPGMLQQVREGAERRGLSNVRAVQGAAEELPFESASFEIVTMRLTSHHFADLPAAMREVARVLVRGGKFVLVDTTVPEDVQVADAINEIDKLRDPSHVRSWSPHEWRSLCSEVGLQVRFEETGFYSDGDAVDFDEWIRRIGTPPENIEVLRQRFLEASPALVEAMRIEAGQKIKFLIPTLTLLAEH